MPKGIAIDFGRRFGFGYVRGDVPLLSLGWVRIYVMKDGFSGVVLRFIWSNADLEYAVGEIARLRALCAHRCPECPLLRDGQGDAQ